MNVLVSPTFRLPADNTSIYCTWIGFIPPDICARWVARVVYLPPKLVAVDRQTRESVAIKSTAHPILPRFLRQLWETFGESAGSTRCLMYWCRMHAERLEVRSVALLFSGDIKATPAAIGKSTKRGQKKGLFAMQTHAHDP
jgi:hypothetical protein